MKLWIMKRLVWLALKCKLYFYWSKIYRFLFERGYRHTKLPSVLSILQLTRILRDMKWKADMWFMLGDVISTPEAAYGRYIHDEYPGDCDEFGILAVNRINNMIARKVDVSIVDANLLTCVWMTKDKKIKGHNVCVYSFVNNDDPDKGAYIRYKYIGNWFNGHPSLQFNSVEECVQDILTRKRGVLIGWSMVNESFKLLKYSNKI